MLKKNFGKIIIVSFLILFFYSNNANASLIIDVISGTYPTSSDGAVINNTNFRSGFSWTSPGNFNINSVTVLFNSTVTGSIEMCIVATSTWPGTTYGCDNWQLDLATSTKSTTTVEPVNFTTDFVVNKDKKYFFLFRTTASNIAHRRTATGYNSEYQFYHQSGSDGSYRTLFKIIGEAIECEECEECIEEPINDCTVYPNEYPTELNQYPDLSIDYSKSYTYSGSSTDPIETTYTFKYSAWRQYLYILSLVSGFILTIFIFFFLIRKK